ncbi:MAG TPA: LuxR C-terminal-related transcriptional regulator [Cyclobacteriaceae bacterium]|nr:LuxR C-terminal-related transcriptional regulator [Cyclobacteriaceae bacterium]
MDNLPILQQALNQWKVDSPSATFDEAWLELVQTRAFQTYHLISEQIFVIIDHTTFSYRYISENFQSVIGWTTEALYKGGLNFIQGKMHPDDIPSFEAITNQILRTAKTLAPEDLKLCRLSFDYRMLFGDQTYHRMLQHNIPLTVDAESNIVHALAILKDISPFKSSNQCNYQVTQYKNGERKILVEGRALPGDADIMVSNRERQIIELTAEGLTEADIARRLGLSIYTVKTHRKNLFRKTGTRNAPELVRFGISHLLI